MSPSKLTNDKMISIHALTRSATYPIPINDSRSIFQSTHSQGVRHKYDCTIAEIYLISIHALTRSATNDIMKRTYYREKFQSTHSQGVRRSIRYHEGG